MAVELKVPSVGESITEVQIGEWLKQEGDHVERDEVLVTIDTDKVTVELPAPAAGTLSKIVMKNGQSASVGDVVGYLEEGAAAEAKKKPKRDRTPSKPAAAAKAEGEQGESEQGESDRQDRARRIKDSLPPQAFARVMPSARRLMKQHGLEPGDVEASGPEGRLLKEDVLRAVGAAAGARAEEPATTGDVERLEEVVPMTPMRRRIAERLVESQHTAALLTTFNEIDMGNVMALRKEHQPNFQEKYGIKLGFMSFFVKAAIEGLKLIPQVNAEIRGTDIVYKRYYDIGVAIGGGKGLVVPVIRNAECLSFAEIEQKIADYGARAKDNKLKLEELSGGTFTISNGGIYGSLLSTPIINPPQSGILGLHAIQERPVVRDGQIVVRPMMYVAVTYDHRLVDGREAVTFLRRIKDCIEDPARILLEV